MCLKRLSRKNPVPPPQGVNREVFDFKLVLQVITVRFQAPAPKIQGGRLGIRELRRCKVGDERFDFPCWQSHRQNQECDLRADRHGRAFLALSDGARGLW